jgi:malonyl-CoA/methylmalonyl-CoA synthetase
VIEPFSRFDLESIVRRVTEDAYTVFMAVPTIYVKLIAALQARQRAERAPILAGFRRMRLMISGSAALPASVHHQWTELTGQKLLERYGMTEIGMALSNPYDGERRPGAVGQPLPGVEIRLHSEQGEVISEENKEGEIQVHGPNVFHEYWNRPELTQKSFDGDWFRTGDIAVKEDGHFRILGRSSVDIIKSGGYKLSALEIEAALLDHPTICECAVVGLPDETWGETVAAAVVASESSSLDLESLQSWCQDKISAYKIPRHLLIADNLPRNAMGKVTKPAVTELFKGN